MLTSGVVWLATGIALVLVSAGCLWRRRSFAETFLRLLLMAYGGVVIAVALFPLPLDPGYLEVLAEYGGRQNNLVPFGTIMGSFAEGWTVFIAQVGGNMLMFFPLGLLVPSIWTRFRRVKTAAGVIIGCSLAVEIAQLLLSTLIGVTYRSFDVDDLVLNTLGGMLGYLCFRLAGWLREKRRSRRVLGGPVVSNE
ncbi:MAG: VanZ family protein [Coriobacteriia bacterium]|nr:VanZ family protein [Coriobacteriia bacterium]